MKKINENPLQSWWFDILANIFQFTKPLQTAFLIRFPFRLLPLDKRLLNRRLHSSPRLSFPEFVPSWDVRRENKKGMSPRRDGLCVSTMYECTVTIFHTHMYTIYVSIRHLNCPEIPATNNFCIVKGLVLQVPVSEHLVHQRVLAADTWLKLWPKDPKDTHSRSTCLRNTLLSFAPYRRYGKGHEGVFKLMVVKKSTNLRNNCCTSNRRTPILFLLREFEIRILG